MKKILGTIGFQTNDDLRMLKSVYRFKPMSSGEKTSLIKIQLNSLDDRYKIIKKAKELKRAGDEFKSIYLHFDLSPSQRYKRKLLVDECKLKNENNKDKTNKIFVIRNDVVKLIITSYHCLICQLKLLLLCLICQLKLLLLCLLLLGLLLWEEM